MGIDKDEAIGLQQLSNRESLNNARKEAQDRHLKAKDPLGHDRNRLLTDILGALKNPPPPVPPR